MLPLYDITWNNDGATVYFLFFNDFCSGNEEQ